MDGSTSNTGDSTSNTKDSTKSSTEVNLTKKTESEKMSFNMEVGEQKNHWRLKKKSRKRKSRNKKNKSEKDEDKNDSDTFIVNKATEKETSEPGT